MINPKSETLNPNRIRSASADGGPGRRSGRTADAVPRCDADRTDSNIKL
jgi:hypothetical protein